MNKFEKFKSMNFDELIDWLDKFSEQGFPFWDVWFGREYCDKCEAIVKSNGYRDMEYAWCELHDGKCKYFQDMNEVPYGKQVIKMWLESEDEYEDEVCTGLYC